VRYGNESLMLWAACPGMANANGSRIGQWMVKPETTGCTVEGSAIMIIANDGAARDQPGASVLKDSGRDERVGVFECGCFPRKFSGERNGNMNSTRKHASGLVYPWRRRAFVRDGPVATAQTDNTTTTTSPFGGSTYGASASER